MAYEVYQRKGKHYPAVGMSVVCKLHFIRLSPDAYEILGKPAAVVLLYDKANRKVAIRTPAKTETSFSYVVSKIRLIQCHSFLKYSGLLPPDDRGISHPATWNEKAHMLEWSIAEKADA
jgi:hypothetical protein